MAESAVLPGDGVEVQNRFGALALEKGFVTPAQLEEAMKVQRAAAKAGFRKRLGDILIKKGYLTQPQLDEILKSQKVEVGKNRVGNYDIISKLGEGAMGAVYKARQLGMEREIALKILSPQLAKDTEFRERFVREARAVAKLNHPYIVAGIDVGSSNGVYYFAMEYVDGESLAQKMERHKGKLPEKEVLEYCRQTALALQNAHLNGLLHRDVKPENIMIDQQGVAKLADLGLVRINRPGKTHESEKGLAIGTPFYISPEQAQGRTDLTPGTDLYSLGATLYHALTGRPPYDADTGREIMLKHVNEPVPDPRKVNPEVSATTARICMKLMSKKPKDRYEDGEALAEDLQRALDGAPPAKASARTVPQPSARTVPEKSEAAPTPATRTSHVRRLRGSRASSSPLGLLIIALLLLILALVAWRSFKGSAAARRPALPRTPTPAASAPAPAPATAPEAAVPPKTTMAPTEAPKVMVRPVVRPTTPAVEKPAPPAAAPAVPQPKEEPAVPEKPDTGHPKGKTEKPVELP
jgi:serine/threonine-protein kinase